MDNPYNKVNSISLPNWNSIMTDRYFQMAAAYPNVNFKGTQPSQAASTNTNFKPNESSQVSSPYAVSGLQNAYTSNETPAISSNIEQQGGMTFGEAALGAAVIGGGALYLIKTGKFSKLLNAGTESRIACGMIRI